MRERFCMCVCVYHFMQYSRVWACVWAGVSGASISNFRSYHPLIVCLKEVFSSLVFPSPHSCWPVLPFYNSSTYFTPPVLLFFSSLLFFLSLSLHVMSFSCIFSLPPFYSNPILFFIPSPLFFPLFLSSVTCFSWSFSLHQYSPHPSILLPR